MKTRAEKRVEYRRSKHGRAVNRAALRRFNGLPAPTRPEPAFCECCGRAPLKSALHLDHDHLSGEFRGWLCGNCNRGLGLLGDTLLAVQQVFMYLLTPKD